MTTSPVMYWLANGVPLTLLCDLASTRPPQSAAIYLDETPPAERIEPPASVTIAG